MALKAEQLPIIVARLERDFVPHLPPLLAPRNQAEDVKKNVSRAFTAFALHKLCGAEIPSAGAAVVDDYDDNGIDAIYYNQSTKELFLLQGKFKNGEQFAQAEAQAFVQGVRDLVNQNYDRFNANVDNRKGEIEAALDECETIVLVAAHISAVSVHAGEVLSHFLVDQAAVEDRLCDAYVEYGPTNVEKALLDENAATKVDELLQFSACTKVNAPLLTYYGQVGVSHLIKLYDKHGNALLERNIRHFLGHKSDVNQAIRSTLEGRPEHFFYLNNGVTAIASEVTPGSIRPGGGKNIRTKNLSVVNGAQTIVSAAEFKRLNPDADIDEAQVHFTLIQVGADQFLGNDITKARNHQNPVKLANFAALDPTQERLRRELALHGIQYSYRQEAQNSGSSAIVITIDEAAAALALLSNIRTMPITLKKEPSRLLDTDRGEYRTLFNDDTSGHKMAIAVRLYRAATSVLLANEWASGGLERLVYRHGKYVIIWLLFGMNRPWFDAAVIPDAATARGLVSIPLDRVRQATWDYAEVELARLVKGPLAFFRNQTTAIPFMTDMNRQLRMGA